MGKDQRPLDLELFRPETDHGVEEVGLPSGLMMRFRQWLGDPLIQQQFALSDSYSLNAPRVAFPLRISDDMEYSSSLLTLANHDLGSRSIEYFDFQRLIIYGAHGGSIPPILFRREVDAIFHRFKLQSPQEFTVRPGDRRKKVTNEGLMSLESLLASKGYSTLRGAYSNEEYNPQLPRQLLDIAHSLNQYADNYPTPLNAVPNEVLELFFNPDSPYHSVPVEEISELPDRPLVVGLFRNCKDGSVWHTRFIAALQRVDSDEFIISNSSTGPSSLILCRQGQFTFLNPFEGIKIRSLVAEDRQHPITGHVNTMEMVFNPTETHRIHSLFYICPKQMQIEEGK